MSLKAPKFFFPMAKSEFNKQPPSVTAREGMFVCSYISQIKKKNALKS